MNLVVDTHALVWHLSAQPRRLSSRVRRAFTEAEAGRWTLRIPMVVMMEIVLLEHAGRFRVSYRELRDQLALRSGFVLEPLTIEDVDEARALGALADPFDRLIVGTAVRLGLPLITKDDLITSSRSVTTYW